VQNVTIILLLYSGEVEKNKYIKDRYMSEFQLKGDYFNSEFHAAKNKDEEFVKSSPGDLTRELWIGHADYNHINPVIESAIAGYDVWRKTPLSERIKVIKNFRDEVEKRKDEIALAIALETGKPLWESKTEAGALAAKVDVTINVSLDRIAEESITEVLPKLDGRVLYRPIGPTLIIGPFNFPCHLANTQILASLLSGNSIIFKPSEKTMYSSTLMFECLAAAGFPNGVVNLIHGSGKTSSDLVSHPAIKGIYFTGSLGVGKKILEATCTDLTKLVALELGGKNTTIVHKDANIDHAVAEILRACFLTSGQRCTSTSTLIVHDAILERFNEQFLKEASRMIIDHPEANSPQPFMGPLIDEHAVNFYNTYLDNSKKEGAELLMGDLALPSMKGHYVSPTIQYINQITGTNFGKTEIFGPNVCITPYSNIGQAIDVANMSDYGLAGSIFTADKEIYEHALRDVEVGIFNLNRSTVGASARLPFGGMKNSGNYHPAAVSMIDHCVATTASLKTFDCGSTLDGAIGLRD
jgi:succinylglutamic semialdehyde dehydrogenase